MQDSWEPQKDTTRYDRNNFFPRLMDDKHPNWKGGTKLSRDYIVKLNREHPNVNKNYPYISEHN
jgi:hypothetical protein